MLLLFFWPAGWIVRTVLACYTLAMAFTLVYGGEHFVIDLVVGYVFTTIAFLIVTYAPRLWRSTQARWRLRTSP
jgi:membrane-associated phospholipid phosphatase